MIFCISYPRSLGKGVRDSYNDNILFFVHSCEQATAHSTLNSMQSLKKQCRVFFSESK